MRARIALTAGCSRERIRQKSKNAHSADYATAAISSRTNGLRQAGEELLGRSVPVWKFPMPQRFIVLAPNNWAVAPELMCFDYIPVRRQARNCSRQATRVLQSRQKGAIAAMNPVVGSVATAYGTFHSSTTADIVPRHRTNGYRCEGHCVKIRAAFCKAKLAISQPIVIRIGAFSTLSNADRCACKRQARQTDVGLPGRTFSRKAAVVRSPNSAADQPIMK